MLNLKRKSTIVFKFCEREGGIKRQWTKLGPWPGTHLSSTEYLPLPPEIDVSVYISIDDIFKLM